jgi:hypothetical protein
MTPVMSLRQLQERKQFVFVDRHGARRAFESLLQHEDPSRVLAVREGGGKGKSHLLRHLDRRCRTEAPRTPVSLVPVDQLRPKEPLTLLEAVAGDLTNEFNFDFSNFWYYHQARTRADWEPFAQALGLPQPDVNISVTVQNNVFNDVDKLNISGLRSTNPSNRTARPDADQPPGRHVSDGGRSRLSDEQDQQAVNHCIKSFFDQLLEQSNEQKVVLLLDGMEACGETLGNWLARVMLPTHFLQRHDDPPNLYLVLAGREIPVLEALEGRWPKEHLASLVRNVPEFEQFDEEAVRALLDAQKVPYSEEHLRIYLGAIESMNATPLTLAGLIQNHRMSLRRAG